jgi:GDP-4-dehydro-6-deoxy-D-mannose reductase
VLVTGITGFAGSHLAEHLVERGDEVHGLAHEDPPFANLANVEGRVRIHRGDITSLGDVAAALEGSRADAVVHLAGMAVPTMASRDPVAAVRVNVLGTAAVLKALEDHPRAALVLASSADVYGAPERVPVDEDAPLRPGNVYSATKVAAEGIARDLAQRRRAPVVILRPANQNGPRQHPGLAASAFAQQIVDAEAGRAEPVVKHGRLDAERDFLDVRDMARAYAAALALPESGTFNVGSGKAVAIAEILDTLIALARVPVRAELDPSRVREGEPARVALDATRFRQKTGWSPRIALVDSLRDTLDHWRSIRARQGARV